MERPLIAANAQQAFDALIERLYAGAISPLVSAQLWASVQAGHTALPLAKLSPMLAAQVRSLLSDAPAGMLILEADLLYLRRFHAMETRIASKLLQLSRSRLPFAADAMLDEACRALQATPNLRQGQAIRMAAEGRLVLLTGGPGTGKSFTLRAIVQVLRQLAPVARIAALAPTANAAQRLAEVGADFVGTVHKALGLAAGQPQARAAAPAPLPFDLVIVDEATMLSAQMADNLLCALPLGCRLVLAGDRFQLASVEAGAIFSQACALESALVELEENHRFAHFPELARFARGVVTAEASVESILACAEPFRRRTLDGDGLAAYALERYGRLLAVARQASDSGDTALLPQAIRSFRLIVATNEGPLGLEQLSERLDIDMRNLSGASRHQLWFVGRMIVILRNDPATGLRNGQVGVCVRIRGEFHVAFGAEQIIAVVRLPTHRTAWAITVHKAQGDEYDEVLFALPQSLSPLATRELLYTAVTRAKLALGIVGEDAALIACCTQFSQRDGGLASRLSSEGKQ